MKHTPAPWIVVEGEDDNGNECFLVDCQDGLNFDFAIATLHGSDDQANANLIAAAPELLEACIQARVKLMGVFGLFGGGQKVNEIFDLLNSVIAKATGEKEVEV